MGAQPGGCHKSIEDRNKLVRSEDSLAQPCFCRKTWLLKTNEVETHLQNHDHY